MLENMGNSGREFRQRNDETDHFSSGWRRTIPDRQDVQADEEKPKMQTKRGKGPLLREAVTAQRT